jgi:uncharacterized cupredoxin-like copper-binding protein
MRSLNRWVLVLVVGLVLVLAACQSLPPELAPPAQKIINAVTFTATEYAFSGPSSIPAGLTQINLVNEGHEAHHLFLARLDEGKTVEDVMAVLQQEEEGPEPDWVHFYGGVSDVAPGERNSVTVNLDPGTYVQLCFVPDEAGVPHFAHGMVNTFAVTAAGGPVPATPQADVTVELADFSINFSKPIQAGKQTLRVENLGAEPHEVFFVKLNPGVTFDDVQPYLSPEAPEGDPPFQDAGGMFPIAPGVTAYTTLEFEPGDYVALCFISSPANGGAPHFALGMMQQFTVN